METKLFDGAFPFTPEWYEGREHAPHREQLPHWGRMDMAADFVWRAARHYDVVSVGDLGAGDGGLLYTCKALCEELLPADRFLGYDLMQTNVDYARDVRGVDVRFGDFMTEDIEWCHLTLITECLEHLEDPHAAVRRIAEHSDWIVASSPSSETAEHHTPEHAWAFDEEGYLALLAQGGYTNVIEHRVIGNGDMEFQVVLARLA